jgi:hypothetical protein
LNTEQNRKTIQQKKTKQNQILKNIKPDIAIPRKTTDKDFTQQNKNMSRHYTFIINH